MQVADYRCDGCGERDLISIKPGLDWGSQNDLFMIFRDERAVCLCRDCFVDRFGWGGAGRAESPA